MRGGDEGDAVERPVKAQPLQGHADIGCIEREKETEIQKERARQRGTETERDARREGETDRHSELMRENS